MTRIENMSYTRVVSDRKLKGSGLKRGDILMVTGTKLVPASKQDPYLMREIFVTIVVLPDGEHQVPSQDNEYKAYLVDPRSLEKVDEELHTYLHQSLMEQYGQG